jgi:hypothetical protein
MRPAGGIVRLDVDVVNDRLRIQVRYWPCLFLACFFERYPCVSKHPGASHPGSFLSQVAAFKLQVGVAVSTVQLQGALRHRIASHPEQAHALIISLDRWVGVGAAYIQLSRPTTLAPRQVDIREH